MADLNEKVKLKEYKQYLKETKAFKPLVEIFTSLHKSDPKPMDPIKFIRDQLTGPTVSMEEFHKVKQNVTQLNETVSYLKTELARVSSFLPTHTTQLDDAPANDAKVGQHNDSSQSMENNVGDSNHASMLNDSAEIFDDTANQTVINVTEHDSIVQANSLSTEDPQNQMDDEKFTMEIVEVDVMSQTSLGSLSASYIEKCIDIAQNDETITDSALNKSELDVIIRKGNGTITFGDFGESPNSSQIEKTYDSDVPDQSSSTAIENGTLSENFTQWLNAEIVIEDAQIGDAGTKSIDHQIHNASTSIKLANAESIATVGDPKMHTNIEDLPIVMKSDDLKDELNSSFRGFDAHDVKQSEKRLSSSKIELCDIPLPKIPEIDEKMFCVPMAVYNQICVTDTLQSNVNENHEQTDDDDDDIDQLDEPQLIIGEILEKIFDGRVQDDKVCADSEATDEATKDVINQIGIEPIVIPKDDPETSFFLSLS